MEMLPIVKKAMDAFRGSFINHSNELILVPRFNVYFALNDVETEEDFFCKMCEWISRDCCCALRFNSMFHLTKYYEQNTRGFNLICGTRFDVKDMELIYQKLGNGINHDLTVKFIRSGFALNVLKGGES